MKKNEQELNETALKVLRYFSEITRLMHSFSDDPEIPLELTHNQVMAAMNLIRFEKSTMTELSNATGISASALTGIIDRLIEKKVVVRERDTQDRRVVKITLSKNGRELMQKAMEQARAKMVKLLEKMLPGDRTALVNVLERIIQTIKQSK